MYEVNLELGKDIVEKATSQERFSDRKKHEYFNIRASGLHRIRVLPPYSASGNFGKNASFFFNMPTIDPAKTVKHVCVEQTFPERHIKCPILEVVREIEQLSEGGKKFPFDAWQMYPNKRYYVNVLIRSSTNREPFSPTTIYIGDFPNGMKEWLWGKILDPDWGNITHPLSGRDIKITRKDENGFTSYDREVVPGQSPIITETDEIEKFLSNLPNLDEVFSYPSDEVWAKINESAAIHKENLLRKYGLVNRVFGGNSNQIIPQTQPQVYVPPTVQQQTYTAPPPASVIPSFLNYVAPVQPQVVQPPVAQSQPAPTPVVTQPVEVKVPEIPVIQPAPVVQNPVSVAPKKQFSAPTGAPVCYADSTVYSDTNPTCNICIYEFECDQAIKTNK